MRTAARFLEGAVRRVSLAANVAATPTNSKFGPPKPQVTGVAERNPGNPRSLRNRTKPLNEALEASSTHRTPGE